MKRKILCLLLIVINISILTGCDETPEQKLETNISDNINIDDNGAALVCTTDYDYTELKYVLGSKYVVFADDKGKVTKVVSREIISSTDETKLDEFESYLNENHTAALQYNGYTYDVKREDNQVISDVTIDYEEFDIKKFAEENENANIDGELTVDSIETKYVSLGAKCERK